MAKAGTAYVEVLGDFSKLRRQLAVEMAKLDKDIELDVDIDRSSLAGVNRELDVTKRSATGADGALGGLGRNLRKTGGEFVSFKSRIPVLQLGLLGAGAYNAAGGVIALTGALAPLTGMLGAIGPLATAAAQGIGTIKLATSGVGDAISAAFAEQDSAASAATASLDTQAQAAEGVRAAHQALAGAQRTAKFAQEDLTQAREDATRQIEDMKASVRSLALEEEGASLSLKEAKQAYSELTASGADELEIERASLRIREAREELKKTRVEGRRAREEMAGVEAGGGVRGMPQVVSARRSLEDANRAVADSQRELVKATKQASQAMASGGAAASAFEEKLAKLPPAGQKFARFIISLRPKIKQLQATAAQGLFPGVEKGIRSASKNLPALDRVIARTSKAFGDLAEQAGQRLGSTEWGKDLETQGIRNERTIRRLGDSGLDLAEIFKDVTLAAGPLVDRLTKWVGALTEGWKESANAARESGRLQRFFEDAGTTFFKTVRILRDLAVSFKNIGSAARQAFGNELLSGIERGARALREWTGSVRGQRELVGIFKDIGDNLRAAGNYVREIVGNFREMRKEGVTTGAALANIFADVFADFVVKAAETGGRFAVAFVRGFLNADIWGKIVLGGLLIQKFGGPAAWAAIGRRLGAPFGLGLASSAATTTGTALPGLLGRLSPKFRAVGKGVLGAALVTGIGAAMSDRKSFGPTNIFQKFQQGVSTLTLGLVPGLRSLDERMQAIVKGIADFQGQLKLDEVTKDWGDFSGEQQKVIRNLVALHNEADKFKNKFGIDVDADTPLRALRRISAGFSDLQSHTTASLRTTLRIVDRNARAIAQSLGTNSKAGRQALRKNFQLAIGDVRSLMSAGVVSADAGARAIRKIVVEALGTFGIKGKAAIRLAGIFGAKGLANLGAGNSISGADLGDRRSGNRRQRGGPIDIGKPVGDSVPAVLERGEYVLNRKAVKRVGREALDRVNFKNAPRFQRGGTVGMVRAANKLEEAHFPYVWGGGHQASPAPFGPMDCSGAVSFVLQHGGVQIPTMVSGALASAGQAGPGAATVFANSGHTFMRIGNRYFGTSGTNPGGGAGWFPDPGAGYRAGFVQRHFAGTGGIGGITLPHQRLSGEPSALKAQVAGALETVRGVGQGILDAASSIPIGAGDAGDPGPAGGNAKANRALGRQMASQMFGWTGGQWSALDRLWTGESGWENVMNTAGSGATGIPQALPGSKMASEGADWRTNPETQIRWGLKYIRDRYGDPVNAYNQWLARDPHWYAQGGIVEGPNGRHAHKVKLPEALRKTLRKIGKTKKKAGRAKLLEGFVKKLGKLGLPKNLMDDINRLTGDHSLFEQYATSAGELTVENDDGTSIPGVIKGLSEVGWTAKDLDAQFKMRNRLVQAREIVVKRRAQVTRAFEIAKNRLKDLSTGGKTPAGWKGLNPARDPVEKWNKQPQAKRLQRKKEWRRKHGSLPGSREFDEKTGKLTAVPSSRISALKKLVPELRDQRTLLQSGIQTKIRVPLEELQGIGGSTKHLRSPWPIGTIPAGSIFQTQLRLQQLGVKPDVTDGGGASEVGDTGRADRLAELLGIERQRSLVRDIEIAELLRTARQPPFAGVFHQGGVVPGPVGAERVALVTGGEVITPPQSKSGSRDSDRFRLVIEDHRVRVYRNDVEMIVDQKLRGVSRGVGRTPGLAGSLKP